ncbi:tandem-95 repeat protein [Roseibium sp.]|uniref:tandem-95 repeat protein n=1 Tax=Roseibium sp. TaxID=1936156 RepID=UPI003A9879A8
MSDNNILVNGDFEQTSAETAVNSVDHGNWFTADAIDGWEASEGRIEIQNNPSLHNSALKDDTGILSSGAVLELDSYDYSSRCWRGKRDNADSTVTQTFTLDEASQFDFGFSYAARGNTCTSDFSVTITDEAGEVVFFQEFSNSEDNLSVSWQRFSAELELDAGSYALSFSSAEYADRDTIGALIDNVSLVDAAPSAVNDAYTLDLGETEILEVAAVIGTETETQTLLDEDFSGARYLKKLETVEKSNLAAVDGAAFSNACADGVLLFKAVDASSLDPNSASLSFTVETEANWWASFEAAGNRNGDSVRVEVSIDGGEFTLLDLFSIPASEENLSGQGQTFVGSLTGQTFGSNATALSYSLPDANESIQLRFITEISGWGEALKFDDVLIEGERTVETGYESGLLANDADGNGEPLEIVSAEGVDLFDYTSEEVTALAEDFDEAGRRLEGLDTVAESNLRGKDGVAQATHRNDGKLEFAEVDISDLEGETFSFSLNAELLRCQAFESYGWARDFVTVEARFDDGSYQVIDVFDVAWRDGEQVFVGRESGQEVPVADGFVDLSYDLSTLAGDAATAQVRLTTNVTSHGEIFEVDDVSLVGTRSVRSGEGIATLTLESGAIVTIKSDGSFSYNANGQFAYLAEGETTSDSFSYTVQDASGNTDTATVTINLVGTNEQPQIVSADATGGVAELADNSAGETVAILSDTGTIEFTDVDLIDTHTVSVSSPAMATDSQGGLVAARGVLTAVIVDDLPADGAGQVTWTFAISDGAVDDLAEGQTLTQVYTVTVDDGKGGTASEDVTITITGTNDSPVVTTATGENEGAVVEAGNEDDGGIVAGIPSATGTLTSSDVDQSATASWSGDAAGDYGSFAIDPATGEWTYTLDQAAADELDEGDTVFETFTATVTDDFGATATQVVTISVTGTNDSPVIDVAGSDLTSILAEDSSDTLNDTGAIVFSDVDVTNTQSAATSLLSTTGNPGGIDAPTALGFLSLSELASSETVTNGSVTWTFSADNALFDHLGCDEELTFTYEVTVTDVNGATDTVPVTVTVTGTNDLPQVSGAVDGGVSDEDAATVTIDLLSHASDAEGGNLGVANVVVTSSDGRSVTASVDASTGKLTIDPGQFNDLTANDSATLSVTYDVIEEDRGYGGTSGAETMDNAGTFFIADNDTGTMTRIKRTASIVNEHQAFAAAGVTNGSLIIFDGNSTGAGISTRVILDGVVSYPGTTGVSTDGYSGSTGSDPTGQDRYVFFTGDMGNVDITVVIPMQDAVCGDSTHIYVLSDVNQGGGIPYTNPQIGGLEFVAAPVGVAATAELVINGVNDAPEVAAVLTSAVAEDDAAFGIDMLAGATDDDTGETATLSVQNVTGLQAGVTISGTTIFVDPSNAAFQYLGVGDSEVITVSYEVVDAQGAIAAQSATITVTGTNDVPVAVADLNAADVLVEQGFGIAGDDTATGNVLSNDSDVDTSDVLSVVALSDGTTTVTPVNPGDSLTLTGTYGTLQISSDGTWNYLLDDADTDTDALGEGETGLEVFTYTISDGNGGLDTATLTLEISGSGDNVPPVANDDDLTVVEDTPAILDLLANDTDGNNVPVVTQSLSVVSINGQAATVGATIATDNGTITIGTGGVVNYIPNANFNGIDSFFYVASDGLEDSGAATVTLDVTAVNDAPTAVDDTVSGDEDTAISGNVLSNDSDIDGDSLTVTAGTFATSDGGSVTIAANGDFIYTPAADFSGAATFDYTVTDGNGGATTATVMVDVAAVADAPAIQVPSGGELQSEVLVNTYTNSSQYRSEVVSLADGGHVVTWSSSGQDGSGWGIYAQRFGSDGAAIGSEFRVNTFTNSTQFYPSATHLGDGGFVIVWSSYGQDGSSYGVFGQRFDATGNPVGAEFQVNTYVNSTQYLPSVASLADGGFVVNWNSSGQDGSSYGIFAQRYDVDGDKVGGEFQVNTYSNGYQFSNGDVSKNVAGLADGGFVISWHDNGGRDGSGYAVFAQQYDASGNAVGGEFQVNTYSTNTQYLSNVAGLSDGGYVITWSSAGQDGSGYGIFAQRYDSAGNTVGSEFQVNTTSVNDQYSGTVAGLATGGFVVVWDSYLADGSGFGVLAQEFDASGNKVGDEVLINTTTTNDQRFSSVSARPDGGYVVTWSDSNADGSGWSVFVRGSEGSGASGDEDADIALDISASLTDTDGSETLSDVVISGVPEGATLSAGTDNNDGTWTLSVPQLNGLTLRTAENWSGSFDLAVTVSSIESSNGDIATTTETFTLTVNAVNDEPVANDDGGFVAQEDVPLTIAADDLLANDTDIDITTDGQVLSIASVGNAVNGSVSLDGNGDVVFTSAANFSGEAQFDYTVSDGNGGTSTATVTVDVDAVADAPAIQVPSGGEFQGEVQANTYTNSTQYLSEVASLADGGHVVTWGSYIQDGSIYGIYAQRFDADGSPIGAEFRVNSYTSNSQLYPSTTGMDEGGFVIVWSSDLQDGSGYGVFGQRYDAAGDPSGSEFRINTYTNNTQYLPNVASLADGGFVVNWVSNGQDGSSYGVFAQRYDADGNAVGSEFRVNSTTAGNQFTDGHLTKNIAGLADGGFVITWQDNNGLDGSGYAILAQQYDAGGAAVGGQFQVNSYGSGQQLYSNVAALDDGGYVITWSSSEQDGNGYGVFGQRYDADGNPVGSEFQVNTFTQGNQYFGGATGLANGGFVVVWDSYLADGSGFGIVAREFDQNGVAVGDEFLINSTTNADQRYSSIDARPDGGYVITWSDASNDGSGWGVFVRAVEGAGALGDEDTDIALEISVTLADTDGSETHSDVTVSGVPNGAILSAGTNNNDGTWTLSPADLSGLTIRPPQDFNGTFDLTVSASSTEGSTGETATTSETFTVTVDPVNDAPAGNDDIGIAAQEDQSLTIAAGDLLGNDTDADIATDGQSLSIVSVSNAVNGTVALDGNGDVVFTPAENYFGEASFEYTVSDGNGGSSTATATIDVAPVNDAPIINVATSSLTDEVTPGFKLSGSFDANDFLAAFDSTSGTASIVTVNGLEALRVQVNSDNQRNPHTIMEIVEAGVLRADDKVTLSVEGQVTRTGSDQDVFFGLTDGTGQVSYFSVNGNAGRLYVGELKTDAQPGDSIQNGGIETNLLGLSGGQNNTFRLEIVLDGENDTITVFSSNGTLLGTFDGYSAAGNPPDQTNPLDPSLGLSLFLASDNASETNYFVGLDYEMEVSRSGAIEFDDIDLTDTHSASVTGVTVTGDVSVLDDLDAFNFLELQPIDQTSDTVDWTFDLSEASRYGIAEGLADGESIVFNYEVEIADDQGGHDDAIVTITLNSDGLFV